MNVLSYLHFILKPLSLSFGLFELPVVADAANTPLVMVQPADAAVDAVAAAAAAMAIAATAASMDVA